tara:strand:- start:10537 stop:10899 length:363 start_codon:yes stop_codon:yes gene_type:complete
MRLTLIFAFLLVATSVTAQTITVIVQPEQQAGLTAAWDVNDPLVTEIVTPATSDTPAVTREVREFSSLQAWLYARFSQDITNMLADQMRRARETGCDSFRGLSLAERASHTESLGFDPCA